MQWAHYTLVLLAQAYGSGPYSNLTYGGKGNGSGTGAGSNGGLLTNTGFDVLVAATLACVIVFAALLIRFWKRPRSHRSGSK